MACHFVDGRDNGEHLVVGDGTVTVNIIQLEGPPQLFVQSAPAGDAQGADELLKVDGPVLVFVKDVEYVLCERRRVAEREELLVDARELGLVKHTRGAVLQEALVPGWRQNSAC